MHITNIFIHVLYCNNTLYYYTLLSKVIKQKKTENTISLLILYLELVKNLVVTFI